MAKSRVYAVVKGRQTGIFKCWDGGAREQVDGFKGAVYRSFATLSLAEEWFRLNSPLGSLHSPVIHFLTDDAVHPAAIEQANLAFPDVSEPPFVVYLIVDPKDDNPFYVGQTGDMGRRKANHIRSASPQSQRRVGKRLAEILAREEAPVFKIVQHCATEQESLIAESEWVKRCSQRGYELCNRWREHRELQELFGAKQHGLFDS